MTALLNSVSSGGWFSRFRNRQSGIDFDALDQFVVALRSELDVLVSQLKSSGTSVQPDVIDTIKEQLDQIHKKESVEHNWNRAYHAEKLMIVLYSAERIEIELLHRLDKSDRLSAPFTSFYTSRIADRADSDTAQSTDFELLMSMIRDMQWFDSRRYINMRYARLAIYKVGFVFILSFASFLLVLSMGHWS